MSTALIRYDEMRRAVEQCARIDEAINILDKAAAVAFFAKVSHDRQLALWVAEIRIRAAIRFGELSAQLPKGRPTQGRGHELATGGKFKGQVLDEVGVSATKAARYERLARHPNALEVSARYLAETSDDIPTIAGFELALQNQAMADRDRDLAPATRKAAKILNGSKRYDIILADPPWRFAVRDRRTGLQKSADRHYPTMPTDEICEIRVPAASDCTLLLWATAPMLEDGLRVLKAWGFEYKSQAMWPKSKFGQGYYFRNQHELLLLGTKGHPPPPAPANRPSSLIPGKSGAHSQKPVEAYEMIERMYPGRSKLEMFAKRARKGWDAHGNQLAAA